MYMYGILKKQKKLFMQEKEQKIDKTVKKEIKYLMR